MAVLAIPSSWLQRRYKIITIEYDENVKKEMHSSYKHGNLLDYSLYA
jgi:hypothetical protein